MLLRTWKYLATLVLVSAGACGDLPSAPAAPSAATAAPAMSTSALAVGIAGPDYIYGEGTETYTWTADVSGGTSPYSYQWKIRYATSTTWGNVGTGSSYTRAVQFAWGHPSFYLRLIVTSGGSTASVDHYVEVQGPPMCGGVLC